jgi:DNA-binding NarL/FixJ family response regulator
VTVRVLIADDQALVRAGLCGILAATPGFTVAGEAATGEDALELAMRTRPDVALMDIRMPGMDGIEATRRLTSSAATRVLILTTFDLDDYVYAALRAGASGFLLKDALPRELLEAIRVIAAGDALLAPSVTRRLIQAFADRTAPPQPRPDALNAITDRETEVLVLVAHGRSNGEIARHLDISPATVKGHIRHLLTKLDARDRVHLVILAYRTGLVTTT